MKPPSVPRLSGPGRRRPGRARGFTLLELMVVVALVALVSAAASLSLRDSTQSQLEREALRLSSLFEVARAQSRASGVPIVWMADAQGFVFMGATPRRDGTESLAERRAWLAAGTEAQVQGPDNTPALVLGPEPLGPPQRLLLRLGSHSMSLASNGVQGFEVSAVSVPSPATP